MLRFVTNNKDSLLLDNQLAVILMGCNSIEELKIYWDENKRSVSEDPNKNKIIEVKEVMKEFFTLPEFKYESAFTQEDCRKIEEELNLSPAEKQRRNGFRIKKLRYHGAI